MGDVFEAMNRARREDPLAPDHTAAQLDQPLDGSAVATVDQPPNPNLPALPVEPSRQRRADPAAAARRTSPSQLDRVVTAATERWQSEHQTRRADGPGIQADETGVSSSLRLNGYCADLAALHDRDGVVSEQYRAIRAQILALPGNAHAQTIVLTSAAPREGKSVTTVNLGITFSELPMKKVLMVEANLCRPTFTHMIRCAAAPGLLQLLHGEIDDLDQAIRPTMYNNLQYLAAGGVDPVASTELLSGSTMTHLLDRLKSRYDHIFIDTPPVLDVDDARVLGVISDKTILVVRLNKTHTCQANHAKRLLSEARVNVAGLILTHQ